MRPIKFRYRVKNRKTGEIITFFAFIEDVENRSFRPNPFGDLNIEILSRDIWTGLLDRHGAEIWENDIVTASTNERDYIYPVEFEDGCFVIKIKSGPEKGYHPCLSILNHIEVLGNRFENPELLEGTR